MHISLNKSLLNDLYVIRDSLISDNDLILSDFGLNDFIRLVETFGFHLVNLDIEKNQQIILMPFLTYLSHFITN
jgi:phosphoenolpyruvate carboxylase